MKRTLVTMAAQQQSHHHRHGQSSLLLLSERDVQQCLSMRDCLNVNRKAFIALAQEKAHVPTRIGLPYHQSGATAAAAPAQDWTLFKPAAYYPSAHKNKDDDINNNNNNNKDYDESSTLMGMKIVSVRANNPVKLQLPLVPATIISLDAETGVVNGIVAGTYLTAARTAAGSALSTALVYQQRKKQNQQSLEHLVVFGAGLQAKLHIQAIATAMSDDNDDERQHTKEHLLQPMIPLVSIINRTEKRALELKTEILESGCWANEVQTVLLDDKVAVAETLSTANVVVTATNTTEPLWKDQHEEGDDNDDSDDNNNMMKMMLPHGCHIAGVGSYTPQMREVPLSTARKCHILMDTPEARLVGDLKDLDAVSHPMTLIGQALQLQQDNNNSNCSFVPDSSMDYTFFKSVGTAIQDVMTADMVVQRAREMNIGQEIDMS